MALSSKEIYAALERLAPLTLAEKWDNAGLLVEADTPVTGVLTALDITAQTVREAVEQNCQLIVSHHPVIFKPISDIHYNNVIYRMMANGISAICMHTNLDSADGGTGDVLARLIGLQQVKTFGVEESSQLGRIGTLPEPLPYTRLAQMVSEVLHTPVKYTDLPSGTVQQLAVITGSAGECWRAAQAAGADALLTGEVSYHHALDAAAAGFGILAAGHYATEAPIAIQLAAWLQQEFPGLRVLVSQTMGNVFRYQLNKGNE